MMVNSAGAAAMWNCPIRMSWIGSTSGDQGYGRINPKGTAIGFGAWQPDSQLGTVMPSGSGIPGPSSVLPASMLNPIAAGHVEWDLPSPVYAGETVTADMSTNVCR